MLFDDEHYGYMTQLKNVDQILGRSFYANILSHNQKATYNVTLSSLSIGGASI